MSKGLQIAAGVGAALALGVYAIFLIVIGILVAASSGHWEYLPGTLIIGLLPIIVIVLMLRKRGRSSTAPQFIQKRQNKFLLGAVILYGLMA